MKVVILCGGKGTRLREETEFRPKPMLPIGDRPILWHIMKTYAAQGHRDFILCLGYKGDVIRDYFRNYLWHVCDVTMRLGKGSTLTFHDRHDEEDWKVTLAETGENSLTATRIRTIRKHIEPDEEFLLTYGDGVGDIDINRAVAEHRKQGGVCTITAVHPPGRFGEIDLNADNQVQAFNEKPQVEAGFINGGYMVCSRRLFDYLPADEDVMLETGALRELAHQGLLGSYKHEGFWQPMDTFHEFTILNRMWAEGNAPWEGMVMFADSFRDRTVWLSGHTGFKGAWLAEWLLRLGAKVHGYALAAPTNPSLFEQLGLARRIEHEIGDVRDRERVAASLRATQPDFVFHLAAQLLVRLSYEEPVETYATNVTGTIHVLDALRSLDKPCAAVIVTTDKCYENREWVYGYREEDPMGGYDPYSSSKGMAELAVSAYRRSFFKEAGVRVATARAGNVIGGGDWARDRIVPDCIRALKKGEAIPVRNKTATRPWQHVLEPLGGYLWLAARLRQPDGGALAGAFNFGPLASSNRNVAELVQEILQHWPGRWEDRSDPTAVHEAHLLQLSTDKAQAYLRWSPAWDFAATVRHTTDWYRDSQTLTNAEDFQRLTQHQIGLYCEAARHAGLSWTKH